jgi:peptide/nickel transport system permease protein
VVGYIVRRVLQAIPMMFLLSVVFFFLANAVPGGPLAGQGQQRRMRPEKREQLERQFGLDKPLPLQYIIWLIGNDWIRIDADGDGVADGHGTRQGLLRGDFGISYRTREPALTLLWERLPNTVYLMSVIFLVFLALAIPIGILSAVKQYSGFDIIVTTLSFAGQAIPEFWLALILVLVFYGRLDNPVTGEPLLPSGGMYTLGIGFSIWDRIKHLILPVAAGASGWIAWYSRFLRSSMLEVIHQDYMRTARAKGLSERMVFYRHALKNALIPVVTMLAVDLPYLIGGSLFIEMIFSWPGMGRLYYQAAIRRDYPVLLAVLMFSAVVIILSNLLADILYGLLDPRVRYD